MDQPQPHGPLALAILQLPGPLLHLAPLAQLAGGRWLDLLPRCGVRCTTSYGLAVRRDLFVCTVAELQRRVPRQYPNALYLAPVDQDTLSVRGLRP